MKLKISSWLVSLKHLRNVKINWILFVLEQSTINHELEDQVKSLSDRLQSQIDILIDQDAKLF